MLFLLFDLIYVVVPTSEVLPAAEEQLEQDVLDESKNNKSMRIRKYYKINL